MRIRNPDFEDDYGVFATASVAVVSCDKAWNGRRCRGCGSCCVIVSNVFEAVKAVLMLGDGDCSDLEVVGTVGGDV